MTGERRAWWRWFVPFFFVCGIWSIASPVFAPPDEAFHVMKAAALAHGEVSGPDEFTVYGYMTTFRVPATLIDLRAKTGCFIDHPTVTPACVEPIRIDERLVATVNGMGRYPPLYYVAIAPLTRLFESESTVYFGRFLSAALVAALLASAFLSARHLGRWMILGVAAGITPMTLYLGGTVNPSGIEIASAVALWASAAALARATHVDTRLLVRASVAFFVLANARGLSLPMALLALAVPLVLSTPTRLREIRHLRGAPLCALGMAVGIVTALAWGIARGQGPSSPWVKPTFSIPEGLERTPQIFQQSVAWLGWFEVRDFVAIAIWAVIWAGFVVIALVVGNGRERIVLVGLIAAGIAFPIAVSLYHPPPIYTSWQGRHSLPLWSGVPILAAMVATGSERLRAARSERMVLAVAVALAFGHLTAFVVTARRYAVGIEGRYLYLLDPVWTGPVHPAIVLVLMVIGLTAVTANVAYPPAVDPPDRSDTPVLSTATVR